MPELQRQTECNKGVQDPEQARKYTQPNYIMEFLQGGSLKEYMSEKFNNDMKFVFEPTWAISMIMLITH